MFLLHDQGRRAEGEAEKEQLAAKMEEVVSPYRKINLQRAAKEVQELAVKVLTNVSGLLNEE